MSVERKLRIKNNIEQNIFLYVLLLFICSVAIRYICSDFVKTVYVYGDELLYYSMAEHFITHRGIAVYNAYTTFRKMFYSFMIMPGFIAKDTVLRGHLFALINSVLVSSTIFPVYYLAKDHIKDQTRILIICFISIIMPDLVYSMTFMSENAFMPMSLWVIYLFTKVFALEKEGRYSLWLSAGTGFLLYLSYFCKNVALVFLAAYILFEIYQLFITFRQRKSVIPILIHLVIIIGVFFASHVAIYKAVFKSVSVAPLNTAGQSGASVSLAELVIARFPYLIYSAFYYGVYIILGAGVLPALFPLVRFKELPKKTQVLYAFLILLCIVAAGVVGVEIFIKEDYMNISPRAHLRYVTYLWMPFLIAYSSLLESDDQEIPMWQYALMLVLISACALYFRGIVDVSSLDEMVLSYLTKFSDNLINLFRIALPIITMAFFWLYRKNRKIFQIITIVLFCGMQILNNAIGIVYCAFCYKVTDTELVEMTNLRELVQAHPEMNFLVMGEADPSVLDHTQRLADTFLNEGNVFTTDVYDYMLRQNEKGVKLPETRLKAFLYTGEYENLNYVNYILIRKSFEVELNKEQCELVDWFDNKYFDLYAVCDPQQLPNIEQPQQLTDDNYIIRVDNETFKSVFLQGNNGFYSYGPGMLLNGSSIKVSPGKYRLVFNYSIDADEPQEGQLGYIELRDNDAEQTISHIDVYLSDNSQATDVLNVEDEELNLGIYFFVDRRGVSLSSIELVEVE